MSDADDTNEVHAIDVDDSGPWPAGWSMEKFVQFLLGECRAGREKRLRYIIYERRIWSASTAVPWSQQAYTGPNPHDKHAHFSFSYVTAQESDTSPYGLKELIEVAFADEKIPLKAAAGVELYDPDRPAGAPVDAHDVLQIGAIHAVRAANTGAALLKGQVAQAATLGLILAAARAADDDAAVVAQADRVIAAIQAVDVSEDVAEIRALLAAAGGSAELAPVLAKLDALPGVLLGRVAAAQQAAVDAIRSA
jgi:hypothetical protein